MAQDVTNASLIPNFLEMPSEGPVGVPIRTKGNLLHQSTPVPLRLDPHAHGGVADAPCTHISDLLIVALGRIPANRCPSTLDP